MKSYNNLGWATDVLSQSARTYLIDYFEEDRRYLEQNHNLMKTTQRTTDYSDPMQVEIQARIQKAAETTMRMKLLPSTNGVLVEYVKGSYAMGHKDAEDQSALSVITMIDLSQDLMGGEAYFSKTEDGISDGMISDSHYNKMIPGPMDNGDSLMYGSKMWHGVEEVISGRRLVLVTWFKEDV